MSAAAAPLSMRDSTSPTSAYGASVSSIASTAIGSTMSRAGMRRTPRMRSNAGTGRAPRTRRPAAISTGLRSLTSTLINVKAPPRDRAERDDKHDCCGCDQRCSSHGMSPVQSRLRDGHGHDVTNASPRDPGKGIPAGRGCVAQRLRPEHVDTEWRGQFIGSGRFRIGDEPEEPLGYPGLLGNRRCHPMLLSSCRPMVAHALHARCGCASQRWTAPMTHPQGRATGVPPRSPTSGTAQRARRFAPRNRSGKIIDPYTIELVVRLKHEEAGDVRTARANQDRLRTTTDCSYRRRRHRGWLRSGTALVMRRIAPRAHGRSAT